MLKEFKEFAIKGNAIDLAVGVVVGAAFTAIVTSLVNDVITPPLSFIAGRVDFSHWVWHVGSRTFLRLGPFLNAVINFLLISFAVFLVIKQINRFRKSPEEASIRVCPYCRTSIDAKATRCPNCTSQLQ